MRKKVDPSQIPHYDQPGVMMRKTKERLNHFFSLKKLSKATGLPYVWLVKLKHGWIKNPSVNRVEYLLKWFMKKYKF